MNLKYIGNFENGVSAHKYDNLQVWNYLRE